MKNEIQFGYQWLKKISLQFISEADFDRIEKHSTKLRFKKGETILKQGSPPSHIVFLEKGIVKFNFENENGKNLILTVVGAPKVLGGANIFYKDDNLFSIIAIEECEIYLIDATVVLSLMMDYSRFSIMLFQLSSEMFKKSVMNFISLAHKHKEGRIADIILFLSNEVYHGQTFHTTLTRKELAEFAGCSIENVIMTLSKWQKEHIVNICGKSIEIQNIEKLQLISKVG
jgi:CRP/FNR family transcriptional regulator, polysaccharide utilization system transcription regulator